MQTLSDYQPFLQNILSRIQSARYEMLQDDALTASENLPEPWIIAAQITEELENALEQFGLIENDLQKD